MAIWFNNSLSYSQIIPFFFNLVRYSISSMFVFLYMMNGDNIGKIEVSDSMTVQQLYMMVLYEFHYICFKLTYNGKDLDEYQHHTKVFQIFGDQVADNMNMYIVIQYTTKLLNMQGKTIGYVQILTITTFKELYDMVKQQYLHLNNLDDEISILHHENSGFRSNLIHSGADEDIVFEKLNIFDILIVVTTETTKNENHKIADASFVLMTIKDFPDIDLDVQLVLEKKNIPQQYYPIYVYTPGVAHYKFEFYDKKGELIGIILSTFNEFDEEWYI